MRILCIVAVSLLLLVCSGCGEKPSAENTAQQFEIDKDYQRGPLAVHLRVDRSSVTIAQTILLELEASIEDGFRVEMPAVDGLLENFGIVDWDNLGDRLDVNNNVVTTYRYELEPFLSGSYALPAFTFQFYDINALNGNKHELTTEPVDIEVTSLLGPQRDELKIAGIEGVVDMPAERSYLWIWILSAAGVIAGAVLWFIKRDKKTELVRIFKSAHEIAYQRLGALVKEDLISQGRLKEFYERISNILRHYIEHRFDLKAPQRSTEEFLAELASVNVLAGPDQERLKEFLTHCDLVKFAKHEPTTLQIQKTFDLVKNFIETTRSEEKQIEIQPSEALRA